ncbi:MAG: hypothetical protein M1819_003506 [Sarea resinae]|nr:MAG: hypothetical protein M1819_003506 [Sarea resinae]
MKFSTAAVLLGTAGLALAQSGRWTIELFSDNSCAGTSLGSFGDNVGTGGCIEGLGQTANSAYFTFSDTNGNGYGNFYTCTEPDSTDCSGGNEMDSCYAPRATRLMKNAMG